MLAAVVISETAPALDSVNATRLIVAAVIEASTLLDTPGAMLIQITSIIEASVANDQISGQASLKAGVIETLQALDTPAAKAIISALINETGLAIDISAAAFTIVGNIAEALLALDGLDAVIIKGVDPTPVSVILADALITLEISKDCEIVIDSIGNSSIYVPPPPVYITSVTVASPIEIVRVVNAIIITKLIVISKIKYG
jgi:hypothetical protein